MKNERKAHSQSIYQAFVQHLVEFGFRPAGWCLRWRVGVHVQAALEVAVAEGWGGTRCTVWGRSPGEVARMPAEACTLTTHTHTLINATQQQTRTLHMCYPAVEVGSVASIGGVVEALLERCTGCSHAPLGAEVGSHDEEEAAGSHEVEEGDSREEEEEEVAAVG